MTEAEWFTVNQPHALLHHVRAGSDRKHRLVACGYARLMWALLCGTGRDAIEIAERYADGEVSEASVAEAQSRVASLRQGKLFASPYTPVFWALMPTNSEPPWRTAARASENVLDILGYAPVPLGDIVREVFGNPFRLVALDPTWLTSDVLALARGIYAERAFEHLPILADALQDAGCNNEAVLNHCRSASVTHMRGCWVIDLLLDKG